MIPLSKNHTLNIAYLTSRYPAISHTFILREVRSLRNQGLFINVASINNPDRPLQQLTQEEKEEANNTYFVKNHGIKGALSTHLTMLIHHPKHYLSGFLLSLRLGGLNLPKLKLCILYFVEAIMIGQWMKKTQSKHLHVHFASQAATVGMITKQIFPISLSYTVHGPDEFYDVSVHSLKEKIKYADFIICIGYFSRSQMMKLSDYKYWNKLEIAPLGVDPLLFAPVTQENENDETEIICVGRLTPAKGQHILISAIKQLADKEKNIKLRIIGDGPDRRSLEKQVKQFNLQDNIIFEGAVNQDKIRQLYAKADIFVLASFAEGIPVVLMEAMAMEIPCISTNITGTPELIRNDIDGILVPASDETKLADAIESLIDNATLRIKLGKAGRQRVIEKYNLDPNIDRLAKIFLKRLYPTKN